MLQLQEAGAYWNLQANHEQLDQLAAIHIVILIFGIQADLGLRCPHMFRRYIVRNHYPKNDLLIEFITYVFRLHRRHRFESIFDTDF